jgi:hypothetical protein
MLRLLLCYDCLLRKYKNLTTSLNSLYNSNYYYYYHYHYIYLYTVYNQRGSRITISSHSLNTIIILIRRVVELSRSRVTNG